MAISAKPYATAMMRAVRASELSEPPAWLASRRWGGGVASRRTWLAAVTTSLEPERGACKSRRRVRRDSAGGEILTAPMRERSRALVVTLQRLGHPSQSVGRAAPATSYDGQLQSAPVPRPARSRPVALHCPRDG